MSDKTSELVVIPAELKKVVEFSGVKDLSEAQKIASNYAPLMEQVNDQIEIIKGLKIGNPEHVPTAKRASLDLGKICSKVKDRKKIDKDYILIKGRFIDALHNTVEGAARISQVEANEIVKHEDMLEEKRLLELQESRQSEALEFLGDVLMIPENLCKMDDEVYKNYLFGIKSSHEARLAAEKKAELERLAKEKEEEEARLVMIAENAKLKLEAEAKEVEEKKKKETRELRSVEMQPYIQFIRKYDNTINLPDDEYKKEISDIKKGANDHWKYEREQEDERDKIEADRLKEVAKAEAIADNKLNAEREANAKLEAELKAKAEAELSRIAKQKQQEAEVIRAKAEAEQAELKKGDSDKVQDLMNDLKALKTKYSFKSAKYKKTYTDVNNLIDKVINHINK